ncbi:MAG: TIGR00282 family metallophosphoesterase [Prevotella sp.]|nr:TIGR00282 family metallophosphoesterase [Alistipes senegalensis]MCM1356975.1 TIGR00282 family metallophosphoesterase [Prevotella sp.]MCM1474013.1 TIGR00282 family metallophosphoesterase [Muribaculaceae bacterium]
MKNLLFIGDVVGKSGCEFLAEKLPKIKRDYNIDVTVVNAENSAQGNGITHSSADSIIKSGADVLTTGNHAFRQKNDLDIFERDYIIRPANYPVGAGIGKGICILDMGAYSIAVINIMGTVYLDPLDNPFTKIDDILENIDTGNIFVDFHAEATSEKKAMGYYLAGKVTGVFGTHTHVQTADETIINSHTAYITDVGMTGVEKSCLGVEIKPAVDRLRFRIPVRFREAEGECFMCGVIVAFDEKTGKSHKIQRLIIR